MKFDIEKYIESLSDLKFIIFLREYKIAKANHFAFLYFGDIICSVDENNDELERVITKRFNKITLVSQIDKTEKIILKDSLDIITKMNLITYSIYKKISNLKSPKINDYLYSICYVLPKLSRQEYLADLKEMNIDLKNQSLNKYWIWFMNIMHFSSVFYHAYKFKLTNYFYRQTEEEKTEIIK